MTQGDTLVLEASTSSGSVAVVRSGAVAAAREVEMRGRDEERLLPAVDACVSEGSGGLERIARVVCGAGPGSFTSLRIAASIAKGICHARDLPLFAVSSLALLVAGDARARQPGRYLAALPAMRDEMFVAEFDIAADRALTTAPAVRVIGQAALVGAARDDGATVIEGCPRAGAAADMLQAILDAGPVDLATWEPTYGRAAEAQVKWEAAHGRPLTA